jgi:hypothetical protein
MKGVFDTLWKPNENPQGKLKILFNIRKKAPAANEAEQQTNLSTHYAVF